VTPILSQAAPPEADRRRRHRGGASLLATSAGVLVAFGTFLVLAVLLGAAGLAIVGMPLDLAPGDWHRLATVLALGAALISLLAYLFGGYVAARLGGHDGLQHGLRVFAAAVLVLGLLGLLLLSMAGPVSVGTGLRQPTMSAAPGQGITVGDVATKATVWSLIAMLLGSMAGGLLGGWVHRRRVPAAQDRPAEPGPGEPGAGGRPDG
jgi:hypothetical protein